MKKYALHPGWVTSKTDGDRHFIGSAQLVRLYELGYGEYVVWDDVFPSANLGRRYDDYIHLYPRYDGNYGRPDAQR